MSEWIKEAFRDRTVIVHKNTANMYLVQGLVKGKVDGSWVDGAIYNKMGGDFYWRSLTDFEGFCLIDEFEQPEPPTK